MKIRNRSTTYSPQCRLSVAGWLLLLASQMDKAYRQTDAQRTITWWLNRPVHIMWHWQSQELTVALLKICSSVVILRPKVWRLECIRADLAKISVSVLTCRCQGLGLETRWQGLGQNFQNGHDNNTGLLTRWCGLRSKHPAVESGDSRRALGDSLPSPARNDAASSDVDEHETSLASTWRPFSSRLLRAASSDDNGMSCWLCLLSLSSSDYTNNSRHSETDDIVQDYPGEPVPER